MGPGPMTMLVFPSAIDFPFTYFTFIASALCHRTSRVLSLTERWVLRVLRGTCRTLRPMNISHGEEL
jgi:hypothetical protein